MRWKVSGADRETGEERTIWLEAASSEGATLLAGSHNMMVANAVEDTPVFNVVSQMPAGRIQVELSNKQLKRLRVTYGDIATGVFVGLLLWSIFTTLMVALFWAVVIAGIFGAASGM